MITGERGIKKTSLKL